MNTDTTPTEKKIAEATVLVFKKEARRLAIVQSNDRKIGSDGSVTMLTASERIGEAEIIYQWLIKDLV